MTDTEWLCGSCTANGKAEQPDKCPECGETHFWTFVADPLVPITLRYVRWLSSIKATFRRPLN
jgi:hypothetical protein